MERNYSPFNPLDGWQTADGTPPYVVGALRELKDCICADQPVIPQAEAPVFSPVSGGYELPFSISITSGTAGADIHYTLDGSDPDVTDPIYDPDNPITITQDSTIKAIAIASGYRNSEISSASYTIEFPQAATPIFDPVQGDYPTAQLVTITSPNGGSLYYTTNGSAPGPGSTLYSGPIVVSADTTIRAIAIVDGFDDSAIANAVYTITALVVATPTFSPTSGIFTGSVDVTISTVTALATTYYTTDGSTPDEGDFLYSGPITLLSTTTLKAKSFRPGYTSSGVAAKTYTEEETVWSGWGSSFNPTIDQTDLNVGPFQNFSQTAAEYLSVQQPYSYEEASLELGAWRFYFVQGSAAAPSAVGGFVQGAFNLGPNDLANPVDDPVNSTAFTETDDNGWPYMEIEVNTDGPGLPYGTYRVYRLINETNGAITLNVKQF